MGTGSSADTDVSRLEVAAENRIGGAVADDNVLRTGMAVVECHRGQNEVELSNKIGADPYIDELLRLYAWDEYARIAHDKGRRG